MVAAPFIAEHISGICQQFLRDRSGDTRIEQMNGLDPSKCWIIQESLTQTTF